MIRGLMLGTVLAVLGAGCAVGQTINYRDVTPVLRAQAPIPLAIAVQDLRTEVVSGSKPPTFVGLFRGGFGNPFDVTTTSKKPLADDFMAVIWKSFQARGYRLSGVPVTADVRPEQIAAMCAKTGATRLLSVQIAGWKTDTYSSTKLSYDLVARVLEVPGGRELGAWRVVGGKYLGSGFWNPGGVAKEAAPVAYRQALEELFNAPMIVSALGEAAPPPPGGATPAAATAPAPAPAPAPAVVPAAAVQHD